MQTQCVAEQQEVNEYFESSWAYWKRIYADNGLLPAIYQQRFNTALAWIAQLNLTQDARILEIGCGAGHVTVALAQSGHSVDAVDAAQAMLRVTTDHATEKHVQRRIRLYLADVHALPFQQQSFDLVIALGVIPWLHSARAAILEMRRILRPGGYLLVTADNSARLNRILDPLSSPVSAPLRLITKRILQRFGKRALVLGFQPKRHSPPELNRLLRSCSFKNLKTCSVGFGPFTFFGKNILSERVGIAVHRRLQTVACDRPWTPLYWTGSHYVVLAVRL